MNELVYLIRFWVYIAYWDPSKIIFFQQKTLESFNFTFIDLSHLFSVSELAIYFMFSFYFIQAFDIVKVYNGNYNRLIAEAEYNRKISFVFLALKKIIIQDPWKWYLILGKHATNRHTSTNQHIIALDSNIKNTLETFKSLPTHFSLFSALNTHKKWHRYGN